MFKYFISSFQRKIARRFSKKYPVKVNSEIQGFGTVNFAHWENPLFTNRKFKRSGPNFFGRFLKEGDVAIDIVANIGHESLQMGPVTGKAGLTLSFDPNPYVYEILAKNSKLNIDKTNIDTFNCAIADKEEEFYSRNFVFSQFLKSLRRMQSASARRTQAVIKHCGLSCKVSASLAGMVLID